MIKWPDPEENPQGAFWFDMLPEKLAAGFGLGLGTGILDTHSGLRGGWNLQDWAKQEDSNTLETREVRVISSTTTTADVTPMEDEGCVACQDESDREDVLAAVAVGAAPGGGWIRNAVIPFTVGRAVAVSAIELQLRTTPFGVLADSGSVWVSIWSATNGDFTPAASRVLVGTFGSIHNHRLSYYYWKICVFLAAIPVSLATGTNYFLCISADDPTGVASDPWDGSSNNVVVLMRNQDEGAGNYYLDTSSCEYPDLVSVYAWTTQLNPWWRIYEHSYTLEEVPLAEPGNIPTVGEVATMRRIQGVHQNREIIAPQAGQRGGGTTATGSGSGGLGPFFTPNAVIYSGATGWPTADPTFFAVNTAAPSATLYGDLYIYDPANPMIRLAEASSTTSYLEIMDESANYGHLRKVTASGDSLLSLEAMPSDGVSAAYIRMFRNTNTAGSRLIYFYQGDGTATINMIYDASSGVLQMGDGSAATAILTNIGDTDTGWFFPAGDCIGASCGGIECVRITNDDVGIRATARLYLDGVACTGDTYISEVSANLLNFAAGGDQWRMSATAFYPVADNSEAIGTSSLGPTALYLSDANTTAPSAEGEIRAIGSGGRRAFECFIGGDLGYIHRLLYAQIADTSQSGIGEAVVSTYTIPAGSWAAGKVYHFAASGSCVIPGGNTVTITVRIGGLAGTVLITDLLAASSTDWRLSGELVCRTRAVAGTIGWGASLVSLGTNFDAESNTGALDTTAAQALVVTHNSTHAGGATTVETFNVWEA